MRRFLLVLLLLIAASPAAAQIVDQGAGGASAWRVNFGGSAQPVSQSGAWSISFVSAQPVTQSGTWNIGTVATITNPVAVTQSGAWAISFTAPQHVIVDSGAVTVTTTDLDVRNLVFATDKVDVSGSTLAANSGVDIGDVTVNNAAGAAAVNVQDGGNSLTVDGATTTAPATSAAGLTTRPLPRFITATGTISALNDELVLALDGRPFVAIDRTAVEGIPTGLISFEASYDGGTEYNPVDGIRTSPYDATTTAHPVIARLWNFATELSTLGFRYLFNLPGATHFRLRVSSVLAGPLTALTVIASNEPSHGIGIAATQLPTGLTATNGAWWMRLTDGTNGPVAVKAPSTAPIATDRAIVVAISPNTAGVDIGDVTILNGAAGAAVNIQDGGNTITVDGTVTVTATNLDVRDLASASDSVTVLQATAANLNVRTDTSGATAAAPPARASYAGGLQSGATGGFLGGLTVCDSFANINVVTATTTLVITGVSGRHVRICSWNFFTAGVNNVAFISGTGATCGTGTTGMTGGTTAATGYNFIANQGLSQGSGIGEINRTNATGDSVCVITSGAFQLSGRISYAIY